MTFESSDYDISLTYVFDTPVEHVWKAWNDSEEIKRWWGPHGFTIPFAHMDVRKGGKSIVGIRVPQEYGNFESYTIWSYTTVVPLERLEFVINLGNKDGVVATPEELRIVIGLPSNIVTIVSFLSLAGSKTEMTIHQYGYTSQEIFDLAKEAIQQSIEKMAAIFIER